MSAVYREAENLLVNPGFERGLEGWTLEGAGVAPDAEHQDARSAGCLKVDGSGDDAYGATLTQTIGGDLAVRLRGGSLSLGLRVAVEQSGGSPTADVVGGGTVGLWASADGGETKREGHVALAQAGYQTIVCENVEVGLEATEVTVGITASGPLVAYIDNAVACRGSAAIAYGDTLSFEPPAAVPTRSAAEKQGADKAGAEKPAARDDAPAPKK